MARLPVPPWRHRDQHPTPHRDDVDADDLRTADLPEARAPGPALAPLALAGSRDPAAGNRLRPARRAAAPAVHQDAHTARRDPAPSAGHLHRDRPAPARHVRVPAPPDRQHRPGADVAGDRQRPADRAARTGARQPAAVDRGRRCFRRLPGVAASRHAAPDRRVGPARRAERAAGALRRPVRRPRGPDARASRGGSGSACRSRPGPRSSGRPRSSACGTAPTGSSQPTQGIFKDTSSFFRRGTSGAGREILSDEEMAAYHARVARLGPPDMLRWLHSPSSVAG